jgi:hypothetical protein
MTARFTTLQKLAEKIGIGIEVEHFSTSNPPYSITYVLTLPNGGGSIAKSLPELEEKIYAYWHIIKKTGMERR